MPSTRAMRKTKLAIIINDVSSKIDKTYYLPLTEETKESRKWTRITSESKKDME